jgi:ADP-ribose pyrophosphatase YjhB (NUDIX family)
MFGAGLVIVQPSSDKFVVVYDTETRAYFLPRGRKDIGESIEAAALREGYEEVSVPTKFAAC